MRLIVTLVIVLAVCAPLSACGSSSSTTTTSRSTTSASTTSAFPPVSPRAALAAMRKAARSQHSVHYISVSSAPGHRLRLVADVGAKEGIERAILTDHGQTGPAAVIVSGGSAYLRGNAFTLRVYFGFTKAQATKYAGKWISVPSSNPGYATVSAGVTFPSYLSQLFQPLTKLSLVTAGGLIGVHGMAPGQTGATVSAAIFAPAHGEPLPVKQTAKSSGNLGAGVVTMSNWGEAVHVPAPRDVVPVKTVVGG